MRRFVFLAALFLTAACGSSPEARFFALEPTSPAGAAVPLRDRQPVVVNAFRLPATYDRLQMVRRGQGSRVEISNVDRWAEPLDLMTRRVLAEDLARRLPPGTVLAPGAPRPPGGVRAVVVDAQEFDVGPDQRGVLNAGWTLMAGTPGKPVLRRSERIEVDAAGRDQASAMSQALGILADRIASTLAGMGG